jgi:hypothetical protein
MLLAIPEKSSDETAGFVRITIEQAGRLLVEGRGQRMGHA